ARVAWEPAWRRRRAAAPRQGEVSSFAEPDDQRLDVVLGEPFARRVQAVEVFERADAHSVPGLVAVYGHGLHAGLDAGQRERGAQLVGVGSVAEGPGLQHVGARLVDRADLAEIGRAHVRIQSRENLV